MREKYYQWLIGLIGDDYNEKYYSNLLRDLDDIEFIYQIDLDENRAVDGIDLRVRYADEKEIMLGDNLYPLDGTCTVLEMMVALACRVEHEILDDGGASDCFWGMIKSLGLYKNDNYNYDHDLTVAVIENFMNHSYRSDGKGGLFTLKKPREDLRTVQIWEQAMWYFSQLYKEELTGWL